jgi:hypothetical protein
MDTQSNATEQARQELLAIHAADRRAHFATDASALVARQAESFVYVGDGAIQRIARDDMRQTFERYFKNATYSEWDDLEPPIVQVSPDGGLGWMITRTKVRRMQVDESGAAHEREFIYAGIMTYEKQAGQWVRTANVSTFEYLKT